MRTGFLFLVLAGLGSAQLVPTGQPIPKRSSPPVVFLNGYQSGCGGSSDFASNFSTADQVLQTINVSSVYFDNCTVPNASIEALGQAFGKFLAGLKYTDGTAVTQVDVVAHSMGGLIVRCYLAGKQDVTPAAFQPPVNTGIRKAIFLSSPNFGTNVASLLGSDLQTKQMSLGSQFLYDLNSWNQGTDDLRGVDILSVEGTGGTGIASGNGSGYDDGVVAIVSSSVGFARPGRSRLVPYCHTSNSLLFLLGSCLVGTPALNDIKDPASDVSKLLLSFLSGTADWQTLGQAIEANPLGNASATVILNAHTTTDAALSISGATYSGQSMGINAGLAFNEKVPGGTSADAQVTAVGNLNITTTQTLPAGTGSALVVKDGPVIMRAIPAAAAVIPRSLAPGIFVEVLGMKLAASTVTSPQPYPTQLSDVQLMVNGTAIPLQYASGGQLNSVFPDVDPGIYQMVVKNGGGQHLVNVLVEAAAPAIFTQDMSGSGAASALNGISGALVTASAPLHAGDYVSLYLTGLGKSTRSNGYDYAVQQPTVTIGGQACNVTFAGRNPVFAGLDQINCQVPSGLSAGAQTVLVTSGGHTSNAATLSIQ